MIIINITLKYNSHFLNNPIKTDLQPIFGSRPTTRHTDCTVIALTRLHKSTSIF